MSRIVSDVDSYPPLFRPKTTIQTDVTKDHTTLDKLDESNQPMNPKVQEFDYKFDPLPVIDFESLNNTKLDQACREWGIFRLINHGIPMTLLNQLHQHARQVLSLPFEYKEASFTPPINYFWGTPGLTPSGVAITRLQNLNWIEGFHVLLNSLTQLHYEDPVLDSFRCVLDEYGRHQTRVATTMLEAMAINLQMDSKRTESYLAPGTGNLRVHRYPRCYDQSGVPEADDQQSQARWGIDVHTDSSILSILHQDDVGGLQVYSCDHQWFDVKPQFDSLIVNLGDTMQAMSDDNYIAAKHRVKVNKHKDRISVGCFVLAHEDTVIESSKYKPFTYADFRAEVQQDLKTVGYKIGLPKFRLNESF